MTQFLFLNLIFFSEIVDVLLSLYQRFVWFADNAQEFAFRIFRYEMLRSNITKRIYYFICFLLLETDNSLTTTRRLYPSLQIVFNTLSVQRTIDNTLVISYRPNNCQGNLMPATVNSSSNVDIVYLSQASDVGGTFALAWRGFLINSN